jgi:Fur family peroxide stress response transcriptional regulator
MLCLLGEDLMGQDQTMDKETKQNRLLMFERLCRERGVPFTVQRRVILESVLDLDNHPTADQVHEVVSSRIPGISRTTVYRTLETLVQMGVITKACHPGKPVRYDTRIEVHHHLVCLRCDEVVDIFDEHLDALPIPDTSGSGFEVSDFRVQLRGVCRRCREKEGKK